MKTKNLLALIAPALLLASCGGKSNTTTISKINLSNAKTLVMGNLKSSSNTSNEEETLITVSEDETTGESTASETTYEVETNGTTTTQTNITIQRLVKLNKSYAVVSCTYNDVSYDLIVNLKTGDCVKFPDSSMLPNTKEKLGGHRSYRKYFKKYGYLNNSIAQPNEDEDIFYYINYYQVAENETTINVRRLVKLDLTDISKPSSTILIAPEFGDENNKSKYSVQSFAVDCDGHVAYYATDKADLKYVKVNKYLYYYDSNNTAIEISYDTNTYTEIEPYFYAMGDGNIYCYLKTKESKHQLAYLKVTTGDTISVEATVSQELKDQGAADSLPTKLLNIKFTETKGSDEKITMKSFAITSSIGGTGGAVINELFSHTKDKQQPKYNSFHNDSLNGRKPSWPGGEPGKPNQPVKDSTSISEVVDGFTGNKYGYLLGKENGKNVYKRIKYNSDGSSYSIDTELNKLLSSYFASLPTAEVEEVEVDGDSENTTVIVDDEGTSEEATSTAVVEIDENGNEETVDEIENATEVVDVNN